MSGNYKELPNIKNLTGDYLAGKLNLQLGQLGFLTKEALSSAATVLRAPTGGNVKLGERLTELFVEKCQQAPGLQALDSTGRIAAINAAAREAAEAFARERKAAKAAA